MSIELVLIPIAIAATQFTSEQIKKRKEKSESYLLSSYMKDEKLLQQALEQYGCSTVMLEDSNIALHNGAHQMAFYKNVEDIFDLVADSSVSQEDAEQFLHHIQDEYTRILQQETYQKLLERAQKQGYVLESEEITDNNSIVLTFKV
ncbi:DUF1257 domain-containing protein [Fictibacillus aquaticus]|uniref:DUF1257 domain-containing protein n=1 Tax=Fictibacillus aquaticus TaxID=2021314 RepID=A0A235F8N6_9BACL|nr:DUF1257 domain-containing protein [Fictibacillus aquaticus]OYD57559.1 hypothetical protein CGZ90_12880 [Fictibacillus aquaticus]